MQVTIFFLFLLLFEGHGISEIDTMSNLAYNWFSTKDEDNDNVAREHCVTSGGAWWYDTCNQSGLNSGYIKRSSAAERGISWDDGYGRSYKLKRVEMKIRPVSHQQLNE